MSGIVIDPTPLFSAISDNLPWIFSLLATPYGIAIGVTIAGAFFMLLMTAFANIRFR